MRSRWWPPPATRTWRPTTPCSRTARTSRTALRSSMGRCRSRTSGGSPRSSRPSRHGPVPRPRPMTRRQPATRRRSYPGCDRGRVMPASGPSTSRASPIRDPLSGELVDVSPSGHIAGIWARTDATRGVHKAPANEVIRGALNVTQRLTPRSRACSTRSASTASAISPREGIRVWGARTLADAASEWRYLNVRRLFNMIEESIAEATRWMVFEPNDRELWKSIRRDVGAFLTRVWRDGALMGRTADEAFFVKCDEETNPPEVDRRRDGRGDHRHRAGEAGGVRHLPHQPARWRHRDRGGLRWLKQHRPRQKGPLPPRRALVPGSIRIGRTTSSS